MSKGDLNEIKNIEKNYYLNLHLEQKEVIEAQKNNLQILSEEQEKVDKDIRECQIVLDEAIKVIFIKMKIFMALKAKEMMKKQESHVIFKKFLNL